MPNLVRVKLADGTEASVGASFAESHGLTVLDKPAVDRGGRSLHAKYPVDLRGKELAAALEAAGLPTSGSADEKRARLADHQATIGNPPDGDNQDEETR